MTGAVTVAGAGGPTKHHPDGPAHQAPRSLRGATLNRRRCLAAQEGADGVCEFFRLAFEDVAVGVFESHGLAIFDEGNHGGGLAAEVIFAGGCEFDDKGRHGQSGHRGGQIETEIRPVDGIEGGAGLNAVERLVLGFLEVGHR